jgi:hypothetical protein
LPPAGPLEAQAEFFFAASAGGVTTVQNCVGGEAPAAKLSATAGEARRVFNAAGAGGVTAVQTSFGGEAPAAKLLKTAGGARGVFLPQAQAA